MLINPNLARPILGKAFMDRLMGEVVLKIGTKKFSRHDLVTKLQTGNFRAARILHEFCSAHHLNSLDDLYNKTTPYELAGTHGIGDTTLYVLLELFKAEGRNIRKWYRLDEDSTGLKSDDDAISFQAVKHRAQKRDKLAAKREKKSAKKRARDKAHRIHEEQVETILEGNSVH